MKKKMMLLVMGLFLSVGFSCSGPVDELEEMEILEVQPTVDDEEELPISKNNGG